MYQMQPELFSIKARNRTINELGKQYQDLVLAYCAEWNAPGIVEDFLGRQYRRAAGEFAFCGLDVRNLSDAELYGAATTVCLNRALHDKLTRSRYESPKIIRLWVGSTESRQCMPTLFELARVVEHSTETTKAWLERRWANSGSTVRVKHPWLVETTTLFEVDVNELKRPVARDRAGGVRLAFRLPSNEELRAGGATPLPPVLYERSA